MADFKTKHMPVDDAPYIAYSGEENPEVIAIVVTPMPNSFSVEQGSATQIIFAKPFILGHMDNNEYGKIPVTWFLSAQAGTLAEGTYLEPLSRTGFGSSLQTANFVQRAKLHVAETQTANKDLMIWAEASNGVKSNLITVRVVEPSNQA